MKRNNWVNRVRMAKMLAYTGISSFRRNGALITIKKTLNFIESRKGSTFKQWARTTLYTAEQLEEQKHSIFDKAVKFSIITPLYNTQEEHLRDMIESVLAQTYPNWELCLGDGSDERHEYVRLICLDYAKKDQRIKYLKLSENHGISGNSNACIEMSEGEYISLLDHDDILHPAALHDVMKKICDDSADFVYTDEAVFKGDKLENIVTVHFKPEYAPDNIRAVNYICHFVSFKRALIEKSGGFCEGFDGSQDHELFLRLTDAAECVSHVPEVLYYWRSHGESTAETVWNKEYAGENGKKAVKKYLETKGIKAKVESSETLPTVYRIIYEIPKNHPKVSIIIPNCDHKDDLKTCIESIVNVTTYDNYEIIIVENNSKKSETFEYYEEVKNKYDTIKIATWSGTGFNWSAINNYAINEVASGEYILLLNNDTEVISFDWIQEMLMYAQRPDVGIVGAKLYFPDNYIQHAGVAIGIDGAAGHIFRKNRRWDHGYMDRLSYAQNLSAVTGACIMARKSVLAQVEGIDEKYAGGLNDIDLCLRVRDAGYLIVWTPYAELYHYESKSRGAAYGTEEDRVRAEKEKDLFCSRWSDILKKGDPYFNPKISIYYK